jgi:hypothetical protein
MLHVIPRAALAVALALGAGAASAQTAATQTAATQTAAVPGLTAGTLAEICTAAAPGEDSTQARAYCRGFLVGVGQFHAEASQPGGLRPVFCLPDPTPSLEAAQAAYADWLRAHPQFAGNRAVDGVLRWAAATYPCPTARAAARR